MRCHPPPLSQHLRAVQDRNARDEATDTTSRVASLTAWPFWRKLDAWFEENARRRDSGEGSGPQTKSELARALGKGPSTVANWYPPVLSEPGGALAARLEELMGARIGYLLDPAAPWPPRKSLSEELLTGRLLGWPSDQLDALALVLQDPSAFKELLRMAERRRRRDA